jgi:diaminopimelate decarboxylase
LARADFRRDEEETGTKLGGFMAINGSAKDYFSWDASGKATFAGHDLAELAEQFPTPFYLLSQAQLRANYEQFLQAFSHVDGGIRVYYSVKSNFESIVLKTLAEMGCGAEISGAMDMELAKRAGMKPDQVVFDGPCKATEDIEAALDWGVHLINIESLTEAKEIDRIAGKRGIKLKVGLRIDPVLSKPYYDKVIATYRKKFGVPIDQAEEVGAQINALPNLELVGIMTHIGSQVFHPNRYVTTVEKIFGLVGALKDRGITIEEINMGGGYPAQSMRNLRLSRRFRIAKLLEKFNRIEVAASSIHEFGKQIGDKYNEMKRTTGLTPRLAIEPGRCLVSNAGAIVGKVLIIKNDWLFTDISINNLPENLFFSEWRMLFPGHKPGEVGRAYNISGPTLATQDVHFFEKEVPPLREGSPMAILDTGAYSIARANQFTRPRIAVYGIRDDGSIALVRRAETVNDVLQMQVWNDEDAVATKPAQAAERSSARAAR